MTYYIKADKFFYPYHTRNGGYLEIKEGKFGKHRQEVPQDAEVKDYTGYWIAPGLVDTHIHGFDGADVMDGQSELLDKISQGLLRGGVTSWIATPLTGEHEHLREVCEVAGNYEPTATGAKIQGLFLEGPYFTSQHKGAQNPAYMSDPNVQEFENWNQAAHGMIRKIAVAPEREGSIEFIRTLTKRGITVALGHSNATFAQATAAVEAGATVFVHTFNGMSPFNHREPGMVGAALTLSNTYTELICDGHHVHPTAAKILIQSKGAAHTVLITDAMRAAGMPDGDYMLGEFPVRVEGGAAHLKEGNSLAGSVLMLKDAIKNVVDWGIATPEEALMMASLTAAKSVNIDDRCGQIKEDYNADFIVLKSNMELSEVYVNGKQAMSS